jgi:hypothetical protein
MNYLRCVKNQGFIWQSGKRLDDEIIGLTVGTVYKALPTEPEAAAHGMVRVIDNSAEDYLYPAHYFEPVEIGANGGAKPATTYLPEWMYGILQAEAIASDKTVSAFLRDLLSERLDLPAVEANVTDLAYR